MTFGGARSTARARRRRALAAGLVVFGIGCLASALVTTAGWLIAMRALTGVGATIAAGSQRWNGITAALPMPNT